MQPSIIIIITTGTSSTAANALARNHRVSTLRTRRAIEKNLTQPPAPPFSVVSLWWLTQLMSTGRMTATSSSLSPRCTDDADERLQLCACVCCVLCVHDAALTVCLCAFKFERTNSSSSSSIACNPPCVLILPGRTSSSTPSKGRACGVSKYLMCTSLLRRRRILGGPNTGGWQPYTIYRCYVLSSAPKPIHVGVCASEKPLGCTIAHTHARAIDAHQRTQHFVQTHAKLGSTQRR